MKKIFIFLFTAFVLFGTSGIIEANSYFFNFEDGSCRLGPLNGLETYMEGKFGGNIDVEGALWWGNSIVYGSDIIYTMNKNAVLDFDPLDSGNSTFKIQSVSFKWLVLDATKGVDFGLDVFDDATGQWLNNYFSKYTGNFASGFTGTIGFDDNLEITRLRIHDNGIFDVGMDNLTVRTVPIPAAVWIFGAGLICLLGIRRKLNIRI